MHASSNERTTLPAQLMQERLQMAWFLLSTFDGTVTLVEPEERLYHGQQMHESVTG